MMRNYIELKRAIIKEYTENAREYLEYFPMWNTGRVIGSLECEIGEQVFVNFSLEADKVRYMTPGGYTRADEEAIRKVAESIEICLEAFGHTLVAYRINEFATGTTQRVRIVASV